MVVVVIVIEVEVEFIVVVGRLSSHYTNIQSNISNSLNTLIF